MTNPVLFLFDNCSPDSGNYQVPILSSFISTDPHHIIIATGSFLRLPIIRSEATTTVLLYPEIEYSSMNHSRTLFLISNFFIQSNHLTIRNFNPSACILTCPDSRSNSSIDTWGISLGYFLLQKSKIVECSIIPISSMLLPYDITVKKNFFNITVFKICWIKNSFIPILCS